MVRQGPQMVRLIQFFFLRLSPIGKLEYTAYSQLPIPFPAYPNRVILTLKRVGGGEITRIQLRGIRTISKHFFTDFCMNSKFNLVCFLLPQKIWGSSAQRLIFGGPKKSEAPYFQIANLCETEKISYFHRSGPNFLRAIKPKRWGPQT